MPVLYYYLAKLSGIDDSEKGKEGITSLLPWQALPPMSDRSGRTKQRHILAGTINKGQRDTTETILAKTNPSYQNSMSKATRLAAEILA